MNSLFSECSSLISVPDISKWNTNNVNDMSNMFNRCSSLKSLPDISKWNTNNVNDISSMFSECSSLIALPDISKWNLKIVKYMNNIIKGCSSLITLPHILKCNINENITNISEILENFNPPLSSISISNLLNQNPVSSEVNISINSHDIYNNLHYLRNYEESSSNFTNNYFENDQENILNDYYENFYN